MRGGGEMEKGMKEEESERRMWGEVFQDGVGERGGERRRKGREGGFEREGERTRGGWGRVVKNVGCD